MSQRIGDFMVGIGAMTEAQVSEVLKAQKADAKQRQFGEIAIELGLVDAATVQRWAKENPQ